MSTNTENIIKEPFRYLSVLTMLYCTIALSSIVMTHKLLPIGHVLVTSVSTFIVPITYVLSDVIAAVYGYRIARKMIWTFLLCEFVFALICDSLLLLPTVSPIDTAIAYQIVVGPFMRIFLGSFIGVLLGSLINIYLITKWKILVKGRYFWLRSVGSSTIGELVFTVLSIEVIFFHQIPENTILQLMLTSYAFKVIFSIIVVFPATILVYFLKNKENIDLVGGSLNANPLKNFKS